MRRLRRSLVTALLLAGALLVACDSDEGTSPTATPAPATSAATPTSTPPPATATATLPPPTATATSSAPAGYPTSCAAGYPWGQVVTGPFICIQFPNSGITPTTTVPLSGYAGGSFENNVVVALRDQNNATLLQQAVTYTAPDAGMPGGWQANIVLPPGQPSGSPGRIVAYFTSPRDGQVVALDSIELRFP